MKRFRKGDLAVTVNSRAPLLNNGHIVRIVEVAGPVPEYKVEFGYYVERIDGRRFVFIRGPDGEPVVPRAREVLAHHWQLRPLAKNGPGATARRARRKIPQTA